MAEKGLKESDAATFLLDFVFLSLSQTYMEEFFKLLSVFNLQVQKKKIRN